MKSTLTGKRTSNKIKDRKKFAKELGQRIRAVRIIKGISLKQFESAKHSFDRHSMSDIEYGKKVPTLYTLYRIALVLGVPLDDLIPKF